MPYLDEIPSFDDPEHEASVDREHEARVEAKIRELNELDERLTLEAVRAGNEHLGVDRLAKPFAPGAEAAWDKYQDALHARRVPIETAQPEQRSSVAVEDMATGSKVKVTSKFYVGSPVDHAFIDAALEAHAYAHRRAAELALNGWQETIEQIRDRDV